MYKYLMNILIWLALFLVQAAMPSLLKPAGDPLKEELLSRDPRQNLRLVDARTTGADCGARINTEDADLGTSPGELLVSSSCGNIATPITVSPRHVLIFVPGGFDKAVYLQAASITLTQGAGIECPAQGMNDNSRSTHSSVTIQQGEGKNLPELVNIVGGEAFIHGCTFDGNRQNNKHTVGIAIDQAKRADLSYVSVYNMPSDGITVRSTGIRDESGGASLFHVISIGNGGRGLSCVRTADLKILFSEFELNGNVGMELDGCNSPRIMENDFGGNNANSVHAAGVYAHGIASGGINTSGGYATLIGNQFGNNVGHDLYIDGDDRGTRTLTEWTIEGNTFAGLGGSAQSNLYDAIRITDSGAHSIIGNVIHSNAAHSYAIGIDTVSVGVGELASVFSGNTVVGTFGHSATRLVTGEALGCNSLNEAFCEIKNAYWANNSNINAKNSSGTVQPIWTPLNENNDSFFNNVNSGRNFYFQINGTNALQVSSSEVTARQFASNAKSGTPPLIIRSTTPVANLSSCQTTYDISGNQRLNCHTVIGNVVLSSGSTTVTFSGSAVFSTAASYVCTSDRISESSFDVIYNSGSSVTFKGNIKGIFRFLCTGN